MKVLWITNKLFPDVCKRLGVEPPVFGGWMYAGAKALRNTNGTIDLGVATLYRGDKLQTMEIKGITYFLVPNQSDNRKYQQSLETYWKSVKENFQPDVIHIHGSEYPHGLAFANACGNEGVVVSIQGLVSIYARYYYGGISKRKLRKYTTLRDYVRFNTLFSQQADMEKRGEYERELLQSVNYVIGRTSWDKSHVWAMNPEAEYHFCNETLRKEFYGHEWKYNNCEKYSIFLSQGHYPIKGFHQIIKALPFILREYPNTKVYLAGRDYLNKPWWRLNGYGSYLKSLMKKHNVRDRINFTGLLSGAEMRDCYLKSNVFVCPSAIENSPNSVGEAQILGVPVVVSYVGGTPDMVEHRETGLLYRFEEAEILANAVCTIFRDKGLAKKLSRNSREAAKVRHDSNKNADNLNEIYQTIYSQ